MRKGESGNLAGVGIVDVDVKFLILSTLTGIYERRDLVLDLLGKMNPKNRYTTDATNLMNSLISYRHGRNKKASDPRRGDNGKTIINMVCDYMRSVGCTAEDLHETLVFGTAEEFAACFTGDYRERAFRVASDNSFMGELPNDTVNIDDHCEEEPGTLRKSFLSGFLTQRLIYCTPDAVKLWNGVFHHPEYLQPTYCTEAHRNLFSSDFWKDYIRVSGTNCLVSLGGGSYKKDIMAIKYTDQYLPPHIQCLDYTVVDYSHRMMTDTINKVRNTVSTMQFNRIVKVHAARRDFMELTRESMYRSKRSSAVFFCFGGTLGNISEGCLLNHIRKIAEPGDLLIVGVDTVRDEVKSADGRRAFKRRMEEKYNNPQMREFLRPALEAVWCHLKGVWDIDDVQAGLRPYVAFGDDSMHSDVPGSASAYWRVDWKHDNSSGSVVLLSSTRYQVDSLGDFAKNRRFEIVKQFASNKNPAYIALVMQYMGEPADDDFADDTQGDPNLEETGKTEA